jgi:hypothetical protein
MGRFSERSELIERNRRKGGRRTIMKAVQNCIQVWEDLRVEKEEEERRVRCSGEFQGP